MTSSVEMQPASSAAPAASADDSAPHDAKIGWLERNNNHKAEDDESEDEKDFFTHFALCAMLTKEAGGSRACHYPHFRTRGSKRVWILNRVSYDG